MPTFDRGEQALHLMRIANRSGAHRFGANSAFLRSLLRNRGLICLCVFFVLRMSLVLCVFGTFILVRFGVSRAIAIAGGNQEGCQPDDECVRKDQFRIHGAISR